MREILIIILVLFLLSSFFPESCSDTDKTPPIKKEVIDFNSDDFINIDCGIGWRFKVDTEKEISGFFKWNEVIGQQNYHSRDYEWRESPRKLYVSNEVNSIKVYKDKETWIDLNRSSLVGASNYDGKPEWQAPNIKECRIITKNEMNQLELQRVERLNREGQKLFKEAEERRKEAERTRKL
ncbi:uncharacterized protein METZ01_LOCUS343559 [marine metagenome]|uniref:Uncharacterized protein n=1 Tax=marine metagenome TaxID=408172 RepID=A0A382R0R1_9ZZZZ